VINRIRGLAAAGPLNNTGVLFLPSDYASDTTLAAGYRAQLLVLAGLLANPRAPSLESAITTGTRIPAGLLHPLSRGTVRLNTTDRLQQPVLNYRSASNPIDMALHLIHLRYIRRTLQSETLRGLGAVEVQPGISLQSDEELIGYIRAQTTQSFMHPCCTTAMMPRSKGGVVGPDLRVHGATGLRVVDAGVFPILPSAHLSATTYAVAEKVRHHVLHADKFILLTLFYRPLALLSKHGEKNGHKGNYKNGRPETDMVSKILSMV